MKSNILRFASISFVLIFLLSPVYAAEAYQITSVNVDNSNDFVLEPGKSELFLNPGDTVTKDVDITSRIQGDTTFKIDVEDFQGSNDPDQPVVIDDGKKGPNSGKDFITPEIKEFTLKFGQKITIPVTIKIPKDAQPGGYYSSVLVSNEPAVTQNGTQTTGTRVISRIGTLFLIRVNGDVKESGNLEDFRLKNPHQLFYDHGPFTFEILYNNDGNVHEVPYGLITVKNIFGSTVAQLPVDAYFALPNSIRYRDVTWDGKFLFGRYTITLQLNRGYKDIIDTKTLAIWILPWKVIIGTIVGLIILITLIVFIVRNFELRKKA